MDKQRRSGDDFAEWMRQEHEALQALTRALREHIALMPEAGLGKWLEALRAGFARLEAHLERNFAAQESDGYLDHLLEVRPSLAPQVESIRHEHDEIMSMSRRLAADLKTAGPDDRLLVADACARVQRFMAVAGQHEQRENMITLFAFNQDIGGHN